VTQRKPVGFSFMLSIAALLFTGGGMAGCGETAVDGDASMPDSGRWCIEDAGPPSSVELCAAACGDWPPLPPDPDCPPTMPREGECCNPPSLSCMYDCDGIYWTRAWCSDLWRQWIIFEWSHCDYFPPDDAGVDSGATPDAATSDGGG
jgi:hypothetical protein